MHATHGIQKNPGQCRGLIGCGLQLAPLVSSLVQGHAGDGKLDSIRRSIYEHARIVKLYLKLCDLRHVVRVNPYKLASLQSAI